MCIKLYVLSASLSLLFIFHQKVDLMNNGISIESHQEYLNNFGKTFYDSVKLLIDRNATKKHFTDSFNENSKLLVDEIFAHAKHSKKYIEKFHGREDVIDKV